MHEALGLAREIRDLLNRAGFKDGGARYQIVVTDTAGNVAEVAFEESHTRWIMDDDVNLGLLNLRLRQSVMELRTAYERDDRPKRK